MSAERTFELVGPILPGGTVRSFLAVERGPGGFRRFVMLRQLDPERVSDAQASSAYLAELRSVTAFAHPYVLGVQGLAVVDGRLFAVTELVSGATLLELGEACRAEGQRLPLGLALRMARDAAQALHYAHSFADPFGVSRPVLHRGVSDRALLLTFEGATKLLDFGTRGDERSSFAAPEQVRGERLDARADVFSLGAVVHSALTGVRVRYAEVLGRAPSRAEFPPPSEKNPEASPQVDALLMRALYPNRESRYASALEFAREIERVAGPLLQGPEQGSALVNRLFAGRREQLKALAASGQARENEQHLPLGALVSAARSARDFQHTLPAIQVPRTEELPALSVDEPTTVVEPGRRSPTLDEEEETQVEGRGRPGPLAPEVPTRVERPRPEPELPAEEEPPRRSRLPVAIASFAALAAAGGLGWIVLGPPLAPSAVAGPGSAEPPTATRANAEESSASLGLDDRDAAQPEAVAPEGLPVGSLDAGLPEALGAMAGDAGAPEVAEAPPEPAPVKKRPPKKKKRKKKLRRASRPHQ